MVNDEILDEFGSNLKAERNRLRLSLEALAEKLKMNDKHLGKIERGEANPRLTTVISIIETLNIPFEALYKSRK